MSTYSTGEQSVSSANSFMGLGVPVHLPSLASPNGADSPFLPIPHHAKAIDMPGITDIPPERQGVDFGGVSYFKYISNDNEALLKAVLVLQLSPLASRTGANPRYVDDIALAAIEYVDFSFAGNLLQRLHGDELHFRMLQELDGNELERRKKLQAMGLGDAERAALAGDIQFVYCELPFFWTEEPSAAWQQYGFQRITNVVVHYRPFQYLVQHNAEATDSSFPVPANGNPTYIMAQWLRFHTVTLSESTKQLYLREVEAQGPNGWLSMITDFERITEYSLAEAARHAAGPHRQTHSVLLNTFSKYGWNIRYWIRPIANLRPDAHNNNRWATVPVLSDRLDISGRKFQPELETFYKRWMIDAAEFKGNPPPDVHINNIPLTEFPMVKNQGMGGIDFSNTANPLLIIHTAPLAEPCHLDIYLYCRNYVRQVVRGNQSAAEAVQPI